MAEGQFIVLLTFIGAGVMFTAVCAYALGLAALRYNNELFLQRAVKLTRKFIVIAGAVYVGWLTWAAFVGAVIFLG